MVKLIAIFITIGISGGIFFLYTKPTYDKVSAMKARMGEFNAALDKARELQELKRSLLSRYNTFTSDQLNRLTRLLPDHVDNIRLILDLDTMAARYGMTIQNVVVNKGAEEQAQQESVLGALSDQASTFDSLTMQFALRGTYGQFLSFIQDLESGLRLVDIAALSIDRETGDDTSKSAEPMYRYNVTIRTYWLK